MTRLIRVELLKIRTTRLSYGLLATGAGLTALFSVLETVQSGSGRGFAPLSTASGLNTETAAGVWALLLAAVLGATVSSGEFRHHTATLTYLATPRRGRVLAAKTIAAAAAGAVFGLAGYVIAVSVGLGYVAANGYRVALGVGTLVGHGAGLVVACALVAALGAALGSLIRSQLAVVIGVFVWPLLIESLLGGLFDTIQPYLPYTAATTLAGIPLGGAAFGPAHNAATTASPLPFAAATALLAVLAAVVAAVAARTTVARDVT
jgi:ABC-type transport system involved in multi-copper enzyme maturation permease subunit